MQIVLKNPKSGELREVKVGWSWTLFFFSWFAGLPLFLRKLNGLGAIFLALFVVDIATAIPLSEIMEQTSVLIALIQISISIWLAIKGNEMTAKNYLELGWEFVDPDSDVTKMAKGKWGII